MTRDRAFKTDIRMRMEETGEPYSVARRRLLEEQEAVIDAQAETEEKKHGNAHGVDERRNDAADRDVEGG